MIFLYIIKSFVLQSLVILEHFAVICQSPSFAFVQIINNRHERHKNEKLPTYRRQAKKNGVVI